MTHFLVGNAPLLTGDAAEVGSIVYLRLIECIGLDEGALAESVTVAYLEGYGVSACLIILIAYLLQRGILGTIENPDGISAGLRGIGGRHLIDVLVNGDLKIDTVHGGNAIGVGSIKAVGRASRWQNNKR